MACPRLVGFLAEVKAAEADYHAAPVESFGVSRPALLIVGLAPGMHGANRTGRPFTGDYAGILLYQTLHRYGLASAPESTHRRDGLKLHDCRITNAVRCLPPANKPTTDEVKACNPFLRAELDAVAPGGVVLALGGLAHKAVLRAMGLKQSQFAFGHNVVHPLGAGRTLISSYHCSRYNTQTRRLTEPMFHQVFDTVRRYQSGDV